MDLNVSIEKLVKDVNMELSKDKTISVNKLCQKINIKKSTLKSRMSRANYRYNPDLRQYVEGDTTSNTTVATAEEVAISKEDNASNITLPADIDFNKLNLLLNNIDKILKLVGEKEDATSNITIENTETVVTSLRINKEIYGLVKERSSKSNTSISTIVNKALLDYLNNYI